MKKICFFLFLLMFATLNAQVPDRTIEKTVSKNNVLFFSFCSVSTKYLPFFGDVSLEEYPNLSKIFGKSHIFKNAFTDLSWSNAKRFIFFDGWLRHIKDQKKVFDQVQDWNQENIHTFFRRIPGKESLQAQYNDYYNDDRLILPFKNFDKFKEDIESRKAQRPNGNVWMFHFKIMHYPYLAQKYLNDKIVMEKTFTKDELKLINEYQAHPEKYQDKFGFFQVVFGEEKFKNLYFNKNKKYISYMTDSTFYNKWKSSPNFKIDQSILLKSYKLRLKDLDLLVGKFLDFYEKNLGKDTILVMSGDHGEQLTEHDYLTHSTTPYDTVLRYFLSIHFPGQTKQEVISKQFSQLSQGLLVEKLAKGIVTKENFNSKIKQVDDHLMVGFSCAGDIVSLRDEGAWKLIYFLKTDELRLYDLKNDPGELHDVSQNNFEIAMKMKYIIKEKMNRNFKLSTDVCITM